MRHSLHLLSILIITSGFHIIIDHRIFSLFSNSPSEVFDEDFVFEEQPTIIGRRTIEILLYDFDSYSRHFCIGGTQIDLSQLDLTHKIDMWQFLGSCSEQDKKVDLGDIMVSMSYLPSAERLTVVLVKARNLKVVDMSRNSSDPYVKLSLIQNGKKIKKKKSGVYRNTTNPVFNEALTFDISKDTLKTCIIEILVAHESLLGMYLCFALLCFCFKLVKIQIMLKCLLNTNISPSVNS